MADIPLQKLDGKFKGDSAFLHSLVQHFDASPMFQYPPGTANHFLPSSSLFKPKHRNGILISDIGLITMLFILGQWTRHAGIAAFLKVYFVPYILANHHIVLLTYLHHCGDLPYYRTNAWTFVRGALSTEDRPLYGWIGVGLKALSHDMMANFPVLQESRPSKCIT